MINVNIKLLYLILMKFEKYIKNQSTNYQISGIKLKLIINNNQ